MRGLKFLLSHSFFVSLCAMALVFQTYLLSGSQVDYSIVWLVFFSALAAYNLYRILIRWSIDTRKKQSLKFFDYFSYLMLLMASGLAIVDFLWWQPYLIPLFSLGALMTGFYFLPFIIYKFQKKKKLNKTILLALTWTFMTVVIPLAQIISSQLMLVIFLFIERFLFLLMLCIIFDYRDITFDTKHKIKTISNYFTPQKLTVIMLILLVGYSLVTLFCMRNYITNAQSFVLICTGALAFVFYLLALKRRGYFYYYFLVDGLMLFSALATYWVTI
jgi:4-hydroxybenzoate polyprenyltransferase